MNTIIKRSALAIAVTSVCLSAGLSHASSHREAPFITEVPKVDGTDFYMFRSYESGREDYVTLIANYLPLQDAYGGPNYFDMDEDALYEIHIDNSGNAQEDLTFQFQFTTTLNDIQLPVGPAGDQKMVSVPLKNIGNAADSANVQVSQEYTVSVVRGDRRTGTVQTATNASNGTATFDKPLDNIGGKSFADYQTYANQHIFQMAIPGCSVNAKVFVGQRKEAFAVNLGEIFDLVNTNPLGLRNGEGKGDLDDKNVTSFALEVPAQCLTGTAANASGQPVIGGWTTASLRQARIINPAPSADGKGATVEGGAWTQVSRLGMPLVNEVVIGLKDKDRFNASEPKDDSQFATYVTNPTLPELLEILFSGAGAVAPNNFPRTDLVSAFLTGVAGVNMPVGVQASEMLRLNPAIAATAAATQNDLGVLGGDNAGFPNGRRPVDDVVDSALRVVMGALTTDAPNKDTPFTDGVQLDPTELQVVFPYLATPLAGSPNS
ncbi:MULTISPECIES: DUF4331 domain-containing protein [unclassified Marinobacter]|jgi:hypothetical protein|uniref:DUF4331 domain-containing protein n=1 Tax=unclassified Marinobacter TaxID=83889 RepID=UPI00200D2720|nr:MULTISPECIES: DUF4331 domain-containing protein [unclassified Marinobacter]MCL1477962.1 DUF4331 domain-containing protein [Marinobacter sp.]MCL1480473.1 DUF4331 domain-containing protein [Marinobacter sp.]MCL1484596.1 DUF4331 domain-containing protein [Marinobacter sp.]MCL1487789.1 DUF4331 domain-containing protein [Marinobacter sp.]UQG56321.1 DUF4331 domain-containing protein [Marinobacter sp. M4C]